MRQDNDVAMCVKRRSGEDTGVLASSFTCKNALASRSKRKSWNEKENEKW
jgi:hypothetical protein